MPGPARTQTVTTGTARPAGDYERFCRDARSLCGIDLSSYRRQQMERRVRILASRRGLHRNLEAYATLLAGDPREHAAFIGHVIVGVSGLWRNPQQWRELERDVLPSLAASGGDRLRCWSAGSSYGAEAYTLAAVALQAAPQAQTTILGTDIDAALVARAAAGRFGAGDARRAPAAALAAHFTRTADGWRAGESLRRLVRFEQGDLRHTEAPPASLDLILCRNTVIYFTDRVRDEIHRRLARSLRPGGVLVIGACERVGQPRALGLEPAGAQIFRRR